MAALAMDRHCGLADIQSGDTALDPYLIAFRSSRCSLESTLSKNRRRTEDTGTHLRYQQTSTAVANLTVVPVSHLQIHSTGLAASTMIFESKLPLPSVPKTDVFNYIFHQGRRPYPWSRVLYRVDQTGETLTLAELEEKSRRLADALRSEYEIMPKDVVGIFAKDRVCWEQSLSLSLSASFRACG